MKLPALGIRWTIGDVSAQGFEALRLSAWGAWHVFGPDAEYTVCVNSVPLEEARRRTGDVPAAVRWRDVTGDHPDWLRPYFDGGMAEGVGWKFAPARVHPDRHELALDNDVILWEMPRAVRRWLEAEPSRCLIAADVRPAFGRFAGLCGGAPRNSGIRGLPPGFDLEGTLRSLLDRSPGVLTSELDEQGLQVAMVAAAGEPLVVSVEDVTICSPFWPLLPHLGRCGAHFVGLNARDLPWRYFDRPAADCVREHWGRHRPALYDRVGLGALLPI